MTKVRGVTATSRAGGSHRASYGGETIKPAPVKVAKQNIAKPVGTGPADVKQAPPTKPMQSARRAGIRKSVENWWGKL